MGRPKRPARERYEQIVRTILILLLFAAVAIHIFRENRPRTYVIADGSREITCTTFATEPEEILLRAGVELASQDRYRQESGRITICRAGRVRLIYHGQEQSVVSEGETVGHLLARLGISPGEGEVLSHDLNERIADGMTLRVDSVTTRQEVYTTTLAHEVKTCTDVTLPAGEEQVLIDGKDGELQRTAEVTYRNGVETGRRIFSQQVTIPAVTELVAVGTGDAVPEEKPAQVVIGDGYIRLPDGQILTYTHTDNVRATGYTHTDAGCDLITSTGTTVRRGTVAVDPRYIPYGTRMFIVSHDGYVYGMAVAEDCGGAIKRDRMDLYFPTYEECIAFGWRRCTVYFLG